MRSRPEPSIVVRDVHKVFAVHEPSLGRLLGLGAHGGFKALNGVSFDIRPGETVGFLGTNGAGKSTLLQLIAGTMQPTAGTVEVKGRLSALLELGAGFNPEWTGRRNSEFFCMIHGATRAELPALVDRIVAFADIGDFFDRPMRTYSSGMFLRVAFAAAIAIDPDIVVVDEALAVGDARFQNKCFNHFKHLQEAGKTILFVTHDTVTMSRFCTRGIVLKAGQIVVDAGPDEAVRAYRQILFGDESHQMPTTAADRREVAQDRSSTEPRDGALARAFSWPPDPARLASRAHYNPQESSAGVGPGQIIDVQLLDADHKPKGPLVVQGERLGIAMQITATRDVIRPCYGIVVKSKDNVYVFGITNVLLGREMPSVAKGETVVACFDIDTRLSRGDYFVDVGFSEMADDSLTILEWRMSVVHFSLQTSAEIYGFVDLNARFMLGVASEPGVGAAVAGADTHRD